MGHAVNWAPNEVKAVDKSHLQRKSATPKWQPLIDKIVKDFELNTEQERAYHIVAYHSCSENPEQLKMNLAGMAGTGKTRMLKALMHLFTQKKEAHQLVIVAPTGSAASLLNGSTYHYMFAIHSEGRRSRVDYVLFDEVSMLSC
ncbi:hypothetical protein L208DRAFT_1298513 [Tricholoma matsutake]|nr:hypothetical protein L208DRAFT_1298513 [Tricholoma matsutake 945]